MRNTRFLILVLLVAVLAIGCVPLGIGVDPTPTPVPSPTAVPRKNIPYVSTEITNRKLDVYLPKEGDGPYPTIFAIHGGCWQAESKHNYYRHASFFNEMGYALVSIDYRFAPSHTYPAQVQDAFCALGWVFANADVYGLDTSRIVAIGESAGGYLAAMLGTVDDPSLYLEECPYTLPGTNWIQGVMPIYGLFDLTTTDGYAEWAVRECTEPYLGTSISDASAELLTEASPLSWVDGGEPPFILVHGTLDSAISDSLAMDFAAELEEVGVKVELLLLDVGHGYFTDDPLVTDANEQTYEAIAAFLESLFEE